MPFLKYDSNSENKCIPNKIKRRRPSWPAEWDINTISTFYFIAADEAL